MPEIIKVHVEQNSITGWYEVHSHGMDKLGQPEIRIETPALFVKAAANLLKDIAIHFKDNPEKKLKPGESIALEINNNCEVTARVTVDPENKNRLLIYGEDVDWVKMC